MNLALATGGLALALTIAGCGSSPRPSVQPDLATAPTWGSCSEFSQRAMSIAEGARGEDTVAAAVSTYREKGDRLLVGPRRGGVAHRWLVRPDDTIHADLEVSHTGRRWFVSGMKQCAH